LLTATAAATRRTQELVDLMIQDDCLEGLQQRMCFAEKEAQADGRI
jgi:hypothetical protein